MTELDRNSDIVIIGLKHCGKSSVAKGIAPFLQAQALDLDEEIARRALELYPDLTSKNGNFASIVRKVYQTYGKEEFQRLEAEQAQILVDLKRETRRVIATGGGTMENTAALTAFRNLTCTVFIDVPANVLFARIMRTGLPAFLRQEDPEAHFNELYTRRVELAKSWADITISPGNNGIETVIAMVLKQIKEFLDAR